MTYQEAIKILHPDTSARTIIEIEYFHGFNGKQTVMEAVNEAILVACGAMEKQIPKRIRIEAYAPTKCQCGHDYSVHHGDGYCSVPCKNKTKFCPDCGQAIDWEDGSEDGC